MMHANPLWSADCAFYVGFYLITSAWRSLRPLRPYLRSFHFVMLIALCLAATYRLTVERKKKIVLNNCNALPPMYSGELVADTCPFFNRISYSVLPLILSGPVICTNSQLISPFSIVCTYLVCIFQFFKVTRRKWPVPIYVHQFK